MQSIRVSTALLNLCPRQTSQRGHRYFDLRRKLRGQLRTEVTPSGGWQWQSLEVAGMALLGLATSQQRSYPWHLPCQAGQG